MCKIEFFTREICVCAHLTQTRDAQRACAEMEISVKRTSNHSEQRLFREEVLSFTRLLCAAGVTK